MQCAETAKPIGIPFGMWTRVGVGPRKHVLDGDADWRNLVNATEPSMCGGDAALSHITLTTCCCCNVVVVTAWFVQSFTLAGKFKSNEETLWSEAAEQSPQTTEKSRSSSLDVTEHNTATQSPQLQSAGDETGQVGTTDSHADDSGSGYDTDQADNNSVIF